MDVQFEWDKKKAASNMKKHKISFEEARTVFDDPLASIFDDESHSEQECREIIIGHSTGNRLVLVCFTERKECVVRLISARLATNKEREDYEESRKL